MNGLEQTIVTTRGTFACLAAGPPTGPLVLCLHGFPDIPRGFEALMITLSKRGARVVAPYLRGYAPSVLDGPYDADTLGRDALALRSALAPNVPAAIVGHDIGALAAYSAATQAPDAFRCAVTMAVPHPGAFLRNLVNQPRQLLRSRYMAFFQFGKRAERSTQANNFGGIERLWARWSPGFAVDGGYKAELVRCLEASWPAPLGFYRNLIRPPLRALSWAMNALFPPRTIQTPWMYLHGKDDGCIGPGLRVGAHAHFSGPYDELVLKDVGHFLHLEAPLVVARVVEDFFERFELFRSV